MCSMITIEPFTLFFYRQLFAMAIAKINQYSPNLANTVGFLGR